MMNKMTPVEIVEKLDNYIIGQDQAKKSVAIALRNRYRRMMVSGEIRQEIIPRNILMIGSTGVGKTEIARRLAKLTSSPFVKVEATKFTEVGYVGRDVESMIRDLMFVGVRMKELEKQESIKELAIKIVEDRILDELLSENRGKIESGFFSQSFDVTDEVSYAAPSICKDFSIYPREEMMEKLRNGEFEEEYISLKLSPGGKHSPVVEIISGGSLDEITMNIQSMMDKVMPGKSNKKILKIKHARPLIEQEEIGKLLDMDEIIVEAKEMVENYGIVFIDEIDKIASRGSKNGPDVSREGVQRDILPLVEGSSVNTKWGPIKTDHVLFIAAGAFHFSKPSELIPELQGRFPIRVELNELNAEDFRRILVEPENALTRQYQAMLEVDNVEIEFSTCGINAIAQFADSVNKNLQNIGARRLHTIMEKLFEDISFDAPYGEGKKIVVNELYVKERLEGFVRDEDLSAYIL